MEMILTVAAAFLLIVLGAFLFSRRSRKRARQKLREAFGQIPEWKGQSMESIASYHLYRREAFPSRQRIDDFTWNDLDMDQIYQRLDSCLTSVGEELLYHILHEPSEDPASWERREEQMEWLEQHPKKRVEMQILLSRLGRREENGLAAFFQNPRFALLPHAWIYWVLALLPLASLVLFPLSYPFALLWLMVSIAVNGMVYAVVRRRIESELATLQYLSSLLYTCRKLSKCKDPQLENWLSPMRSALRRFRSLTGKLSAATRNSLMRSDTDLFLDICRLLFLSNLRNYNRSIRLIAKYKQELEEAYRCLGEWDIALCVLSFRKSLPVYTLPVFEESSMFDIQQLFHPLLDHPVPNSISLTNDCLITGSNASGKSTFIKAVAVNAILAQTIYTCTATRFHLRPSLTVTSMAVRDDITAGDSYFITEIKSMKRILDRCAAFPCLCVIDEILKGTNTIERIAASASVLLHLHEQPNCLCIAASHDIELTALLKNQYDSYHFSEQIDDTGIRFDYTLKEGPSQTRNAIRLLEYMEFPANVVAQANQLVTQYEETETWVPFHPKTAAAQKDIIPPG